MRKFLLMVITLLCLPLAEWVDGVWADEVAWTGVATEGELRTALLNSGITISNGKADIVSEDGKVSFKSTYGPVTLLGGDKSNLFLSTDNTLYYPVADQTIKPFRAYFHVDLSGGAEIKVFVLRFGDETTSIQDSPFTIHNDSDDDADDWYDLQGRRLSGKPAISGVYLFNGKKIIVK